jgi:L-threonylcarbamoyladenylate synthase
MYQQDCIEEAISVLREGGVVGLPTETVYGLAGAIDREEAISRIFHIKGRPSFNPLIVHIGNMEQLGGIVSFIPDKAQLLMEHFWPGPITFVLPKSASVSLQITGGLDTVAVRMPSHPLALDLINKSGLVLAAPSANPSGRVSPTQAEHVRGYFSEQELMVLDGGPCEKGIESTILGFNELGEPVLYRKGSISKDDIEAKVGPIHEVEHAEGKPLSPGMLSRHYAPQVPTYLTADLSRTISEQAGKKIGVLSLSPPQDHMSVLQWEFLSANGDLEEAMFNLYAAMHRLDKADVDVIILERMPDQGLGHSINDRLQRAAAR